MLLWQGQSESCLPQFVFRDKVWALSNEMCRLQGAKPSAAQDLRLQSGVFAQHLFQMSFCCEDVDIAKVGQDIGDAGDGGEAASWRFDMSCFMQASSTLGIGAVSCQSEGKAQKQAETSSASWLQENQKAKILIKLWFQWRKTV